MRAKAQEGLQPPQWIHIYIDAYTHIVVGPLVIVIFITYLMGNVDSERQQNEGRKRQKHEGVSTTSILHVILSQRALSAQRK